jgi:diguanylate cyclase (GGDEF)-like protein
MQNSVQQSYQTLEAWTERSGFLTDVGRQEFQGYAIPEKLSEGTMVQRSGDLVARYGGEAFVFLLPHTDGAAATLFAQKVRAAIYQLNLLHRASEVSKVVTVSLGVASFIPQRSLTPEGLVMAADRALYQAKQAGRDCVVQGS